MRRSLAAISLGLAISLGIGMVFGLQHVSGGFAMAGPKGTCCPLPAKDQSRLPQGYWPSNVTADAVPVKTISYRFDPALTADAKAMAAKPSRKPKRKSKRRSARR